MHYVMLNVVTVHRCYVGNMHCVTMVGSVCRYLLYSVPFSMPMGASVLPRSCIGGSFTPF